MDRAEPDLIERRTDRAYDEQNPSTYVLPNDTLMCSYDRALLGAAGRAILDMYAALRPRPGSGRDHMPLSAGHDDAPAGTETPILDSPVPAPRVEAP